MSESPNLLRMFIALTPQIWDRFVLGPLSPFVNTYFSLKYKCWIHPLAKISTKGVSIGGGSGIGRSLLETYGGKGKIEIGSRTTVYDKCELFAHRGTTISVGDDVFLARRTVIMTADHVFADRHRPIREQGTVEGDVRVGNDVWIGYGVLILRGVTIGDGCVVGAGSVITRDLEPYSVAVGVPAKVIKRR